MLVYALVSFGLAAFVGLTLAYLRITGKGAPLALALFHGFLAGVGLLLLALGLAEEASPALTTIFIAFLAAAGGGLTLSSFRFRRRVLAGRPDHHSRNPGGLGILLSVFGRSPLKGQPTSRNDRHGNIRAASLT